jgi:hypothetical protein
MKKQNLLILAGITAMTLASCGGSTETIEPGEAFDDMMETYQQDDEEPEVSSDEDEMEVVDESSASDEWNETLDGYEDYVDDYVALIKKQKADPTDMSIMTEYQELMQKGTEWSTKMSEMSSDFGPEQLTRMQEIQAKLSKGIM